MSSTTAPTTHFNRNSTAEEVARHFAAQARDRHVIVTGANTGLGFETACVLAQHGAIVTVAARSLDKGNAAVAKIKERHPAAQVSARQLDLASLASVDAFADAVLGSGKPLHILINNAGVMAQRERETTRDGYEAQFAVNHLGHFHLVRKLSPLLARSGSTAAPSRVVNLSSVTHVMFAPNEGILFDDINGEKDYQNWVRYGHAKLATVLFSHELNKRFKAAGEHVQSVALHPGIIKTDLYAHTHEGTGKEQMMQGHFFKLPLYLFDWSKSVPQGAATTVVCALDPGLKAGGYYKDCRPSNETHVLAFDDTQAARLWAVSEEMVDKALKANRGRI